MIFAVFDAWLFYINSSFYHLFVAVLLSITVHFIAVRLGRTIMHQHTKILLK